MLGERRCGRWAHDIYIAAAWPCLGRLGPLFLAAFILLAPIHFPANALADPVILEKAFITPACVESAIVIEKRLDAHASDLHSDDQEWFTYLEGTAPILITAPHATSPIRDGTVRFSDRGTGSLAIMLNRIADAPVLYTNGISPEDPNRDDSNAFKTKLKELLTTGTSPVLVLDLHGSDPRRPYDIDFGTMANKSLLGKDSLLVTLVEQLRRDGLHSFSKDFFPASTYPTITKWVSGLGIPCIQLEINSSWLRPEGSEIEAQRFAQILESLSTFICAHSGKAPNKCDHPARK